MNQEQDVERFAVAIAKALQQSRSVSDSEHYDHHKWIAAKIDRENAWRTFWEEMTLHARKWKAFSVISGAFYAIYLWAEHHGYVP